jgi:hypothetical protein
MNAGQQQRRSNRRLAGRLALMAAGSFAFGYALVPLYDVFCQVVGIGSREQLTHGCDRATRPGPDLTRMVTVEFVASNPGRRLGVPPASCRRCRSTPGKLYETTYHARNLSGRETVGQAVPSVSPHARRALLPEDRVLLLHAAALRARRDQGNAGPLHRGPGPAGRRGSRHAVLRLLRYREARPGGGDTTKR